MGRSFNKNVNTNRADRLDTLDLPLNRIHNRQHHHRNPHIHNMVHNNPSPSFQPPILLLNLRTCLSISIHIWNYSITILFSLRRQLGRNNRQKNLRLASTNSKRWESTIWQSTYSQHKQNLLDLSST